MTNGEKIRCRVRVGMVSFELQLATALLFGCALVLVQALGILLADVTLVVTATAVLRPLMVVGAGAAGLVAFALAYVMDGERGED